MVDRNQGADGPDVVAVWYCHSSIIREAVRTPRPEERTMSIYGGVEEEKLSRLQ